MKTNKLLTILTVATLPFLASCMSPTEKIARGLDKRTLTTAEAQYAIADGAEVSADFLEKAARQGKVDLVKLFVSKGANPWEMKSGTKTFSLFDYAVRDGSFAYLKICLDVKERCPELAEKKATAYVESVIAKLSAESASDCVSFNMSFCAQVWDAGLALPAKSKMEAEQKRIAEEKAEQKRIAEEKAERERLAELERQRLEKERQEKMRKETAKMREALGKKILRTSIRTEIFIPEQKLSEEERSRGWALLEVFGEEYMPTLTERCKEARQAFLESKGNLDELSSALRAEGTNIDINSEFLWAVVENEVSPEALKKQQDPDVRDQINDIFQAAGTRWVDLASEYWWLRYKLTDFYSQFKIGAITPDELAAKDAEFVEE
ncbi:MAG: hypothetical protein E7037_08435 [Verrucomicrobia bacterium]|nr:hypothetical protein [Verrucomicrobiota bacterium]